MKFLIAFLVCTSPALAQCYSRSYVQSAYPSAYYTPAYAYSTVYAYPIAYPYIDQRFQVTYDLAFPPLAATGSTVYGYAAPQAVGLDPAAYLNAASRYAEYGSQVAQTGANLFNTSVNNLQAYQQHAAELQFRQKLAQAILSAPPGSIGANTGSVQFAPGANGQMTVQASAPQPATPAPAPPSDGGDAVAQAPPTSLQGIANQKCIECHGGARKERGLDLRNLGGLNENQVQLVLKKIMSTGSDRMPPPDKPQLSPEEKMAFVAGATKQEPPQAKLAPAGASSPGSRSSVTQPEESPKGPIVPQVPKQPAAPATPVAPKS